MNIGIAGIGHVGLITGTCFEDGVNQFINLGLWNCTPKVVHKTYGVQFLLILVYFPIRVRG